MSSQSDIAQQFIDGGVVPADLVGQETVSKTYVDGQIDIQDAAIAIIASQAATAQSTANNGVSAAATAQSTANTAVGAAAAAQTAANTAQNTIDLHKVSSTAHSAANITYNGPVLASNVKSAIDTQDQRINNIVASGGTSNVEIVDARQPATGSAFTVLRDRLNNADAQLVDMDNLSTAVIKFPAHAQWRAAQGVTTNGTFIYTFTDRTETFTFENIISIYDMTGKFVSEKRLAYTGTDPQGKFMSFGDGNIIDGFLYVTAYNLNDGGSPLVSRVIKYNLSDLSVANVYEIGGNVAESVTKHNNAFWAVFHDILVVRKFDLNFNFVHDYPLTIDTAPHGYFQGSLWEGDTFYANLHGHNLNSDPNPFAELRKFAFDGTSFNFVEKIDPPTIGCNQGISEYSGYYFWNDRPNHSVVITKSIKKGSMYPKTIPYVPSDSFKPTLLNSWEAFDLAYDRTARVTVLNGVVYLSGIVKNTINANAFNGFTPMITIPNHLSPKYSINFVALSNKGPIRIAIAGRNTVSVGETGNVNPQNILSYTDIAWVSLDGLIYPIMD